VLKKSTGRFSTAADLVASLIDAAVVSQQGQYFPQRIVVVQVAVQQLEQPGIGRIGRLTGQQRRQCRDALAKISPWRLAGVIAGDVDDVVAELEHHPNLLAEVGHDPLQVQSCTRDLGTKQCRRRDQGARLVRHDSEVVVQRICTTWPDGLGDLTLHQPGERTRLDPYELRTKIGHDIGRTGEQQITDQDGYGVSPA
jgi:hypothetical protein